MKKGAKRLAKQASKEIRAVLDEDFGEETPPRRRRKRAPKPPVTRQVSHRPDSSVGKIIKSIEQFQAIREPSRELSYQDMLGQHLKHDFPNVRLRYKVANTEIDAFIDGVGIEVKVYLNKSEADRLFGQLALFLRTIAKIVVVAYRPNLQWLQEFEESVQRNFPRGSVFVVVK